MSVRRCALLACALIVAGCNSQRPPPSPARFEQPNSVDFVCVVKDKPVSLDQCAGDISGNDDIVPYAVVTQHARGEIAAVNIKTHKVIDSRRDIPGYTFTAVGQLPIAVIVPPQHPELTYVADFGSHDVRVLQTSPLILPLTAKLGEPVEVQTVPLSISTSAGTVALAPTQMALTPDEDALFLAIPEQGTVLWLPLQRCTGGATSACRDGFIDVAKIATIKLAASADHIAPPAGSAPHEDYQRLCGFERTDPAPPAAITPSAEALAHTPRPSGFAIDAFCFGSSTCLRRLLVADDALPLIHAIDIDKVEPGTHGSDALLPPIVTGVPTHAVAVTPHVPKAIDSDEATQYVYAIDATDGSVLVTENGRVLNLDPPPAARPDRIQFDQTQSTGAPAAAGLTVLTPNYDPKRPVGQWVSPNSRTKGEPDPHYCTDSEHEDENPARLRGVFLAVAMSDGTIRIIDVHDMELHVGKLSGQDGKTGSCRTCPKNPIPVLVRHHERLASNFLVESGEDLPTLTPSTSTFQFEYGGVPFPVHEDGTSGSPDTTGLACFACRSGFTQAFPQAGSSSTGGGEDDAGTGIDQGSCTSEDPALLCTIEDPWTLSQEQWIAVYEGHLPSTTGGDALFLDPSADPALNRPVLEVAASADFCAAGVIGEELYPGTYTGEDCPENYNRKHPPSDQLVITSPIPGDEGLKQLKLADDDHKACQDARKAIEADPTLPFAFGIRRAYRDRLMIDEQLVQPVAGVRDYQRLRKCLGGGPMTFDVRARNAFVVLGSEHGFQHRVTADASGRCIVDPDAPELQRGRVRLGCTFRNQSMEWRAQRPTAEDRLPEPKPGVELVIRLITPAGKLRVDTSFVGFGGATVVPTQLRYNSVDQLLYLVDISDRGLVPIPLDPLPASVDATQAFN